MSEKITAGESIVGVMQAVSKVGKTGHNDFQNFNFRGIDATLDAVGPALREVGGFIVPRIIKKKYVPSISSNGKPQMDVRLDVEYAWYGTDGGDPIRTTVPAEASDSADKGTAKAMSVAYRTYLLQILCLPTGDPDPDESYPERGDASTTPVQRDAGKAPRRTSTRATAAAKAAGASGAIPQRQVASRNWIEAAEKLKTMDELRKLHQLIQQAGDWKLPVTPSGPTVEEYMVARKKELEAAPAVGGQTEEEAAALWPVASIPE